MSNYRAVERAAESAIGTDLQTVREHEAADARTDAPAGSEASVLQSRHLPGERARAIKHGQRQLLDAVKQGEAGKVEVLWEGKVPGDSCLSRVTERNTVNGMVAGVWDNAAGAWQWNNDPRVAAHLARRLAAVECELGQRVEAAYREGHESGAAHARPMRSTRAGDRQAAQTRIRIAD